MRRCAAALLLFAVAAAPVLVAQAISGSANPGDALALLGYRLGQPDQSSVRINASGGLPPEGLVFDLQITEGTGQIVGDASGNNYDWILGSASGEDTTSDPSWDEDGGETVLTFSAAGDGDFLTGPDMAAELSNAASYFLVVKLDAVPPSSGTGGIQDLNGQATTGGQDHYTYSNSKVYLGSFRSNRAISAVDPVVTMTDWHVLTITSIQSGAYTAYQNLTQLATSTDGAFAGLEADPQIGRSEGGALLNGKIARVILYDRVLDESERTAVYNVIKTDKPGLMLP